MIRLHIHLHHDNGHLVRHENLSTIEFFIIIIKNYVCYSSLFYAQASFYAQFSLNNDTLLWFCADVRGEGLAGGY